MQTVSARKAQVFFGVMQLITWSAGAQVKERARDLGIPFEGAPGPLDAITDVKGVEVGMVTLISGEGPLKVGSGPIRTGVTAVLPRGKGSSDPVFAGWFSINGNGEMTGTTWVEEGGFLEGTILITNTHSVGVVRDAAIAWSVQQGHMRQPWSLPVVAETYDGYLNDINGFHVSREHVFRALDEARPGAVAEGNVGGGTGMICYGFKCGTGTASRKLREAAGGYTVGVLVQTNHGSRSQLRIAGVPVGAEIPREAVGDRPRPPGQEEESGSVIVVGGTDAPLLPHQLKRLARRATHGLGRTGATSGNGSGDIVIAFSTANPRAESARELAHVDMVSNERISPLFEATAQATEEAIINALVAGETMTGCDGHTAYAIPHDRLRQIMKKYNR